jgi:hypothetical protein
MYPDGSHDTQTVTMRFVWHHMHRSLFNECKHMRDRCLHARDFDRRTGACAGAVRMTVNVVLLLLEKRRC